VNVFCRNQLVKLMLYHHRTETVITLGLSGLALLLCVASARADDGQIEKTGGENLKINPEVVSQPILTDPIYACASSVVVRGYAHDAKLEIFVAGDPSSIGTGTGTDPNQQTVNVSPAFMNGQSVTAIQIYKGVKSKPSNAVVVKDFTVDYPAGLPQPRVSPAAQFECGQAVGAADVVPGAWWKAYAEDPKMGGGFDPPVQIGGNHDFSYTFVSPALKKGQGIRIQSGLCTSTSKFSDRQIVALDPPGLPPKPIVEPPVVEGADIVVVSGPAASPSLLDGAAIEVYGNLTPPPGDIVGGQPTPGDNPAGQQIGIGPIAAAGSHYSASQALCTGSGAGPKTPVLTCSQLPVAKIRSPLPGDTEVDVTDFVPGSQIYIFDGSKQIGLGGGSTITLTQPVAAGDKITVVQEVGSCKSSEVFVAVVGCGDRDPNVCSGDWPVFRHSGWRDGQQPITSVLTEPEQVRKLKVVWTWTPPDGPLGFRASPIVYKSQIFIGDGNGRFYALNEATGTLQWEYPPLKDPALLSKFINGANPSGQGLAASASIGTFRQQTAVVFGGPDQSIGLGLGSGRLFALEPASGGEIWKSPEIAVVSGTTSGSLTERHEQFGYSSPLVLGDSIYIGMADHGDNPIQKGRVAEMNGVTQLVNQTFFVATNPRGGGIWSSVAGGLDKGMVAITTGNSNINGPEPSPDHALSMIGLDATSGAIDWTLRPVPYADDSDPDWAAGPALLDARCGHVAASTQKDGWTYSVDSASTGGGSPSVHWQFPPTGIPFPVPDGRHGDTRYIRPGAGWNDTYITMDAGYPVEVYNTTNGFTRLHALDTCGSPTQPILWISDNIPSTVPGTPPTTPKQTSNSGSGQLGPPTVTKGIVFIGTSEGHLVALADPAVYPSANSVCVDPTVTNADCEMNGLALVPQPLVLRDIDLNAGAILSEPALANGRVFVATTGGSVIMLEPGK
jgi:outer membrane protein assembly factor BamB